MHQARCQSPMDDDECDCETCDPAPRSCLYASSSNGSGLGPRAKRLHSWKDMPSSAKRPCGGKPCHVLTNNGHEANQQNQENRSAPSPYSESEILRHNYYHNHNQGVGHHHQHPPAMAPLSPLVAIDTSSSSSQLRPQLITFYGAVITVSVSAEDLVEAIKTKIEAKEGINCEQQLLFFAGQQLEDEKPLSHYHINSDTSRHLVLRLRDGMKIFVKTLSDKTIEVQVDPSETIEIVKVKIHEQEGISPCDQRLLQDGRDLADLRTLSDYGIKHKSTLQLDLHLGGPCPICQTQFKNADSTPGSSSPTRNSSPNSNSNSSSGKGSGSGSNNASSNGTTNGTGSNAHSTPSPVAASPRHHGGKHD